MKAALARIAELLKAKLGLDAESVSPRAIETGVALQMKAQGVPTLERYLDLLGASQAAMDDLVEAMVVPETWFFRDREPFRFLEEWVRKEWQPTGARGLLRALSIPCSTGEEPYSVAMALRHAGLPCAHFRIDAVDISRHALERARQAVYKKHSFREKDTDEYEGYFKLAGAAWTVQEEIAQTVRFHHANALDFCAPGGGKRQYEIIFCRNLLIYLDEAARRRLIAGLDQMLAPDGLFFLGHAEAPHVFLPEYQPMPFARSFAARKVPLAPEAPPPPVVKPPGAPARFIPPQRLGLPVRPKLPAQELDQRLDAIEQRVLRHELNEAEKECLVVLEHEITCAQAWFWLGVIAAERQRPDEAIEQFNRALYLEPYFAAALRRMSEVLVRAGKSEKSTRYRRLAERAETAGPKGRRGS